MCKAQRTTDVIDSLMKFSIFRLVHCGVTQQIGIIGREGNLFFNLLTRPPVCFDGLQLLVGVRVRLG